MNKVIFKNGRLFINDSEVHGVTAINLNKKATKETEMTISFVAGNIKFDEADL